VEPRVPAAVGPGPGDRARPLWWAVSSWRGGRGPQEAGQLPGNRDGCGVSRLAALAQALPASTTQSACSSDAQSIPANPSNAYLPARLHFRSSRPRGTVAGAHRLALWGATPCGRFRCLRPSGGAGLILALYGASDAGALPTAVGSLSFPGFCVGLPSVGPHLNLRKNEGRFSYEREGPASTGRWDGPGD